MTQQHRGSRFGHALSQLMPNTKFPLYCSLHQTLTRLTQIVTTGINTWNNADSLAVTAVLVAATVEAGLALMAAARVVGVVVMIVVVPAGAVPVELSLHSQVLTYLHICNPTITVNDNIKNYTRLTPQRGYKHTTLICIHIKHLCHTLTFKIWKTKLNLPFSS